MCINPTTPWWCKIYLYFWCFFAVTCCGGDGVQTFCSGVEVGSSERLCLLVKRRRERPSKCIHSAALHVCESVDFAPSAGMRRVCWGQKWHAGSFLWAWACAFITPTPQKTKVGVVCELQYLQSTYQASSFLVEMTSKNPYTLTANISLYQTSLCPSTCFSINISPCVKPETRGHLCLSIMCRFLPSGCIGSALNLPSLNDWSGWEVRVYGGGGQCRL